MGTDMDGLTIGGALTPSVTRSAVGPVGLGDTDIGSAAMLLSLIPGMVTGPFFSRGFRCAEGARWPAFA